MGNVQGQEIALTHAPAVRELECARIVTCPVPGRLETTRLQELQVRFGSKRKLQNALLSSALRQEQTLLRPPATSEKCQ